jgi:hypothetical protein
VRGEVKRLGGAQAGSILRQSIAMTSGHPLAAGEELADRAG